MFQRLRRLLRLYKFLKTTDEIYSTKLTDADVKNISLLYVDDKYKSLEKLYNNIIIDLQNKAFRDMQSLEEFMGVKWARQVLLLLQNEIKQKYLKSIKPSYGKIAPTPEDLEGIPDGVPISS